ncbi:PGL/p-HBAD biosynthesis glycosyltransferase [mine drainage metagenome]|uniref:PGL/p-HBAD biosynthesis glycosyltransferase n=1 Tax=mine drainage metagenome TaxID=410659 RepID=A0A1J5SID5_9ZZZZ
MTDAGTRFRHWIDSPVDLASPPRRVVVRGWCYARTGAVDAVRARCGWRIHPGHYGLGRQDVHDAFPEPGAERSGFEIAVRLPALATTCELQARCEDGAWHTFAELPFAAPPAEGLRDALRRARFWRLAWTGDPRAWDLVPADEQEYLVSRMTCRDWLTIARFEQHPPRPLAPVRLPSPRAPAARLPAFAIVTPSFNQAAFLRQAVDSVLSQPGVRVSYAIQDGGSTDGSADILRELAARPPAAPDARLAHWESAPDEGQADAILRGFAHLQGGPEDVMAYLNSDDRYVPGAFAHVAGFFARHPEVDVVYGHRILIDESDREIGRWITPRRRCDDLRIFDMVPQETLFWRRRIWDRVGGIDRSLHFALDWDLLQRFEQAGARFARLPRFLGMFRWHGGQKTRTAMERSGVPEMERLRERAMGRPVPDEEFRSKMRHVQFDSALVNALLKIGLRV